jgi:hypothetical protein
MWKIKTSELLAKYPSVPSDVLLGLELEDDLHHLDSEWCVVKSTYENEWTAHGFDSVDKLKGHIKNSYGEGSWGVHSVYHNAVPVKFNIKHIIEVKVDGE